MHPLATPANVRFFGEPTTAAGLVRESGAVGRRRSNCWRLLARAFRTGWQSRDCKWSDRWAFRPTARARIRWFPCRQSEVQPMLTLCCSRCRTRPSRNLRAVQGKCRQPVRHRSIAAQSRSATIDPLLSIAALTRAAEMQRLRSVMAAA
jgi:hypothetical protein